MITLSTEVRYIKGVGEDRAKILANKGILTAEDLLYYIPFRYEDRRQIKKIGQAVPGKEESFIGQLVVLEKKYIPSRRRQMVVGRLADEIAREDRAAHLVGRDMVEPDPDVLPGPHEHDLIPRHETQHARDLTGLVTPKRDALAIDGAGLHEEVVRGGGHRRSSRTQSSC